MGQRDLPTSMTIDQEFPRKVSHGKCGFLFRSVELWGGRQYNGQSCQRQKKKKTHDKKGKAGKNAEKKDQESSDSLRNTLITEISSLG